MRLIYFDEVKPSPNAFPDYLYAGISLQEDVAVRLLKEFVQLRDVAFVDLGISPGTEVHAQDIYHGKKEFKGKDTKRRIEFIADIIKLVEPPEIRLVYAWVDIAKLIDARDAPLKCFTLFCERAHMTVDFNEHALLIGDLDASIRSRLWQEFRGYRANGTPWAFGTRLDRFVDSVHFVDSRVCDLVQIADVYAFWLARNSSGRAGYQHKKLNDLTSGLNLWPARYKIWPRWSAS